MLLYVTTMIKTEKQQNEMRFMLTTTTKMCVNHSKIFYCVRCSPISSGQFQFQPLRVILIQYLMFNNRKCCRDSKYDPVNTQRIIKASSSRYACMQEASVQRAHSFHTALHFFLVYLPFLF